MKTAKNYSGAKTVYFRPEIEHCPHCKLKLKRHHIAWDKHVIFLKQTVHVYSIAYRCSNPNCPRSQHTYRSSLAETLALKYHQYSFEVAAKIGHLRFQGNMTIRQAKRTLKKKFHLNISRSEVQLLSQTYLSLLSASKEHDPTIDEKFQRNGGVVLSIDGVQPEKGNETLFILRDTITGEPLLARNLESTDTDSVAALMKEVKAKNIPVKSIVSDGQRSIRLAAEKAFSGIPHQICHYHYLNDIARPISEMDRALKTDLKKHVRGVRTVERRVRGKEGRAATVILAYCKAIRSAILNDGLYPLKPGGLQLYRRLTKIRLSLLRSNTAHSDSELERLIRVLGVLDAFNAEYRRVNRMYKLIFEARNILNLQTNGAIVKLTLWSYLQKLEQLKPWRLDERNAVKNILTYTRNFWPGLFYCYDIPDIPRTNNDLERFIRKLKTGVRKTTGCRSTQGLVLRYGAYLVYVDKDASQKEVLSKIRQVPTEVFLRHRQALNACHRKFRFNHYVLNNLEGFLQTQEMQWAQTPFSS